jgi:hypothetical protein
MGVHGCDGCCGLIFGGLVEQTEERIIKLLEERTLNKNEEGVTLDLQYVKDGLYGSVSLTPEITEKLIELIKGETNE